uniref:Uncharacterized protein n=1 Tax=viral metagenome TaxID=1070528 RepID=A0A6M3Y1N8_9ZZZZ
MEDREYGVPKTEEEREATHQALYGSSNLPPRGTGQNPGTILECAAQLIVEKLDESMRADDTLNLAGGGVTEDLKFEVVKPRRELILEFLAGYNETSACTIIRVGYWNGHRFNWLNSQPAPLRYETVSISGRIHLREGMYPVIRFVGGTDGDDLYAALNGYWIKT